MVQDIDTTTQETQTPNSSLSTSKYAFSRQKLNEIVKALRDCGTEEIIKLPKIVVIGNQSAGKSSLIEAISRIKVPRASGTCTRCPMEVILTSAKQKGWHCKVSLRIDYPEVTGQQLGIFNFDETGSPDKVSLILRRAQLAILNPKTAFSQFFDLNEDQCAGHQRDVNFSKNTVVLEIMGANVDVTFIDLPGIISNTEKVCPKKTKDNSVA
jgi:GTPase SAR1 family protein